MYFEGFKTKTVNRKGGEGPSQSVSDFMRSSHVWQAPGEMPEGVDMTVMGHLAPGDCLQQL